VETARGLVAVTRLALLCLLLSGCFMTPEPVRDPESLTRGCLECKARSGQRIWAGCGRYVVELGVWRVWNDGGDYLEIVHECRERRVQ